MTVLSMNYTLQELTEFLLETSQILPGRNTLPLTSTDTCSSAKRKKEKSKKHECLSCNELFSSKKKLSKHLQSAGHTISFEQAKTTFNEAKAARAAQWQKIVNLRRNSADSKTLHKARLVLEERIRSYYSALHTKTFLENFRS